MALITIVIVYGDIPLDTVTLSATLFIFIGSVIFFALFRWLVPPSEHARHYLERQQELKQTERQLKRLERYKKIQDVEHDVKEAVDGITHKIEQPFKKIGNLFKKS